ncbi:MAG: hypothetical protein ACTSXA_14150 [Candidatus Heimdallarchaeota archaeon]
MFFQKLNQTILNRRIVIFKITFLFSLLLIPNLLSQQIVNGVELQSVNPSTPDWLKTSRIVGYEFWEDEDEESIREKVLELVEQNVNVLELDIGLIHLYESFFNPDIYIEGTERIVEIAHEEGLFVVEYIAGFELITEDVDTKDYSILADYPEWIQRDLDGNYAVYGSELGFWVEEGDESAWITPLAPAWRAQYMSIVADLAATGVDGIYIDVPFWRTWYSDDNEWTWGSFDDFTVAEFTSRYSHAPPADESEFNLNNPVFVEWLQFRTDIVSEFFAEVSSIAKGINPNVQIIAEIWLAQGLQALLSGADPYYLYDYLDAIAYEFGTDGDSKAYTEELWLYTIIKNLQYRALDNDHPSWILDYAVRPVDSTMLAAANVMFEGNFWETKGPDMDGTVGLNYRTELFDWISKNDHYLYGDWDVVKPVAIYYSPQTRDFVYSLDTIHNPILDYEEGIFTDQFWGSYNEYIGGHHSYDLFGLTAMLLQSHIPTKIITSRDLGNLEDLDVQTLILPDVAAMNETEIALVTNFAKEKSVIVTGNTSLYHHNGTKRSDFGLETLLGTSIDNSTAVVTNGNCTYIRNRPGEAFWIDIMMGSNTLAETKRIDFITNIFEPTGYSYTMTTSAPKTVILNPYSNGTDTIIRAVNFDGTRKNNQFPNEQSFTLSIYNPSSVLLETNSPITINFGGIITFDGLYLTLEANFYLPTNPAIWYAIGFSIGGVLLIVFVFTYVFIRKRKTKI